MNWRRLAAITATVLCLLMLAGCAGGGKEVQGQDGKPIKVVFWYSLGGKITGTTKALVDQFNASHKDIQVEAVYQGSYDDAINKLKQSIQSKNTPHVMQSYVPGVRFLIDSKAVVPIQKWADAEKFDLSVFEPTLLSTYSVGNTLYCMPFNNSTPILYYNKNMFKAAGLDPDKPPQTFGEVAAAARALTVRENGKIVRPGIILALYGWFFEEFLAAQGVTFANNGNGREGLATATTINCPEGEKVLSWWHDMFKEGICGNIGRITADTQKAFISGQTAMTIDSTAVLGDIMDGVNGKFEVGTAFLPRPEGANGGVVIGGGSLWIMGGHSEAEEKAAWEFIKFMSAPKQQAYWHINTGYFPVHKLAYEDPALKAHWAKYPQFKVAVDQLHATPINYATQGALLGVFTQARQEVETAMEAVMSDQLTPKDALQKAAATIDASIARYNQTVK